MKLGIIGGGLTSLSLAKSLVNQGIIVDLFFTEPKSYFNKGRTIGISKENLDFFNKNILDIRNITWDINKIEIFSDKLSDENILNFEKKKTNHFLELLRIMNYKKSYYLICLKINYVTLKQKKIIKI